MLLAERRRGSSDAPPPYVPLPTPPIVTPPVVPPLMLSVSLLCNPASHGTPTVCNVEASYGATALDSNTITEVDVDWGDGPNQVILNTPLISHSYAQAGSYRIATTVTAATQAGAKTATATASAIVP